MDVENPIERFDVPTVDAIMQIPGVDRETAEKVVAVLDGTLDPCEASPQCAQMVADCVNKPRLDRHDVKLAACDELLGMYGVVSLNIDGDEHHTDEGLRMCPAFSYCNTGDSYALTLGRDHSAGQWVIASWADLAEEYEQENELGDYEEFEEKPDRCVDCHAKGDALELEHFPNSARGDSYSWVCYSCNHHHFAVMGYEPEEPAEESSEVDD